MTKKINDNLSAKFLHQQFLILGRERNKVTYKLLALLPQIYKQKIYEKHGYATIYEYAGKLAGLSHSTVQKALNLEKKLENKPLLQKAIEKHGVHKVAIIANLATPKTEKMFVDKITNMSKPALQQLSKELRGKITGKIQTSWQIEMDEEMMKTFLKLKKNLEKFGSNLSNKEALRRMLKKWGEESGNPNPSRGDDYLCENTENELSRCDDYFCENNENELPRCDDYLCGNNENKSKVVMAKTEEPQRQAEKDQVFTGDFCGKQSSRGDNCLCENTENEPSRCDDYLWENTENKSKVVMVKTEKPQRQAEKDDVFTGDFCENELSRCDDYLSKNNENERSRYIPVSKKRLVLAKTNGGCSHPNCQNPAQVFHHQIRFSQSKSHESIIALCRIHHEFAHNGITENISPADELYRKYRQMALAKNTSFQNS
jgi:hypothetical protein